MRFIASCIFLTLLLIGCAGKQTTSYSSDREIDILVERIKDGTADGFYGSLTQQQIERLLYLTSPKCQDRIDKDTREKINEFLQRIREENREEGREDEEEREREVPAVEEE